MLEDKRSPVEFKCCDLDTGAPLGIGGGLTFTITISLSSMFCLLPMTVVSEVRSITPPDCIPLSLRLGLISTLSSSFDLFEVIDGVVPSSSDISMTCDVEAGTDEEPAIVDVLCWSFDVGDSVRSTIVLEDTPCKPGLLLSELAVAPMVTDI